ncbi:LOW QUALITY PROTEIN: hypothetical protein TESG_08571 [Trichophyton tonsurans CBS 112818]|uniref:Uncharacterized protein n=1 Tax=Trichophyton tonsurans (strain CBS 112818) TaxID=647933 RepID=F2S5V6_TRIT1|nr:LOW QUALITY PROTEIN: hypothetical protein TESG_08571 [Trichophyton tonsurans CBS 112818]
MPISAVDGSEVYSYRCFIYAYVRTVTPLFKITKGYKKVVDIFTKFAIYLLYTKKITTEELGELSYERIFSIFNRGTLFTTYYRAREGEDSIKEQNLDLKILDSSSSVPQAARRIESSTRDRTSARSPYRGNTRNKATYINRDLDLKIISNNSLRGDTKNNALKSYNILISKRVPDYTILNILRLKSLYPYYKAIRDIKNKGLHE